MASREDSGRFVSKIFSQLLPPHLLKQLQEDFGKVVASDFHPPPQPECLTFGTYWFPLDQGEPRNAIESTIMYLAADPLVREVVDVPTMEGVEWWYQKQDHDDAPKELHVDCDTHRNKDGDFVSQCPAVSSVFYLGVTGGPTVVFDQSRDASSSWSPRFQIRPTTSGPVREVRH
mmetsp:Transcript_42621/g.99976  ORF Transcript_42621/g.99976 Transcript_42621/m.99976 type:complete len:174 (-) Transcript_42621:39-560(-)